MGRMRTPIPKGSGRRKFSTRNLRGDLLDQMRLIATWDDTNLEDVFNRGLAAGLPIIKAPALAKYKARRRAAEAAGDDE